uniref:Uncharacterized protein n=1 Tax=Plectus sambesii TaxID=2011161 RepID=A0A914VIH0_9BILA
TTTVSVCSPIVDPGKALIGPGRTAAVDDSRNDGRVKFAAGTAGSDDSRSNRASLVSPAGR